MKKCPNCGTELNDNHAFCKKCGTPVPKEIQISSDDTEILSFDEPNSTSNTELDKYPDISTPIVNNKIVYVECPTTPPTPPVTEPSTVPSTIILPLADNQKDVQPQINQAINNIASEQMPLFSSPDTTPVVKDTNKIRIFISLILGIISIVLLGLPIPSIAGIIIALTTKKTTRGRNKVIVLNIIGLIIGVITTVVLIYLSESMSDDSLNLNKTYKGTGYTIKYGDNWEEATVDNIDVIKFKSSKSYLAELDNSSYEDTIKCDFNDISCQNDVYNDFYEFWRQDIAQYLDFEKDYGFKKLKDDIYIAKYSYKVKSTGEVAGKYYLIVSKSKNAVLSFVARVDNMKIKYFDSEATLLLTSINIDSISTRNNTNNWEKYEYLRNDVITKNMTLKGEYRILAEDNSYWVFNDEEFWYFKSEDKRNDNYWYGRYKYSTGKKGLASLGMSSSEIKEFESKTKKNIDMDDVYSITLMPERIISSGQDKSSEIPEKSEWRLIWILINHKKEGIEAQVLNYDNNDYSYYFKVKD